MTARPVKDLLPMRVENLRGNDEPIRERDAIRKAKGKQDADTRRNATESDIQNGDVVFLKNHQMGKLEPRFSPVPFKVINRKGNETFVQSTDGTTYRRCVTHLKKWRGDPDTMDNKDDNAESDDTGSKAGENRIIKMAERPKRIIHKPTKYM